MTCQCYCEEEQRRVDWEYEESRYRQIQAMKFHFDRERARERTHHALVRIAWRAVGVMLAVLAVEIGRALLHGLR